MVCFDCNAFGEAMYTASISFDLAICSKSSKKILAPYRVPNSLAFSKFLEYTATNSKSLTLDAALRNIFAILLVPTIPNLILPIINHSPFSTLYFNFNKKLYNL